ncbi:MULTISPECIES: regulatory protein RecX [Anaerococcus]|uniref:regulatory protein RecX n=1 Tax=Anaerococcus TaxID=165779 RepID=UPI0024327664|nr:MULTISPECIES: regulatory protein RecX [Anaerococcus]MDD7767183.1 regulatory protein RecX [Anaerococcus vaginalis]MDY6127454.1 regulatory protein RecX [Anaerococcus sp.]
MIVENIEYSDKYNLVKITISNEFFYISYDFFNDLALSLGAVIDFDLYKEILRENDFNRCKNEALKQLSYGAKTSFDLKKKLKEKKFNQDSISRVIDFLTEYDLIDDKAYVKSYINDKSRINNWSKGKIRYKLKAKHIDDSLIDTYLDEISYDEEYEKAYDAGLNKKKSVNDKNKVYRFLASRGFSYDIISDVLGDLFK